MNETLETINSLRTIHGQFSDKKISQENLDIILESSLKAANASSRQNYSIIILDNKEDIKEICGYEGQHAFIFSVDYTRIKNTADFLSLDFDFDDIMGFITGSTDTILAVQTAVIAAKSLGIDSLITNGIHRKDFNELYDMLNLPKTSCFPLVALVLGYKKQGKKKKKGRLDKKYIIHHGKYRNLCDEEYAEIVNEYDDIEKNIGLINNWKSLGYKHYLEWFYTNWTKKPKESRKAKGKNLEVQNQLIQSKFWMNE